MEEGEPLNNRRWKTEWNCARRALRAEESEAAEHEGRKSVEVPHMVTHDLRHFCASALTAGGTSVKQVQMVLGHASAVITLRTADLRAPVAGRRRPHPVRQGRRYRRPADRVRNGRRSDQRKRRSDHPAGDQAFLVSQKIRSTSAIRSRAFWPVFGSFEPLAAESAFRVSLTSWCSSGYFSKCGGLK